MGYLEHHQAAVELLARAATATDPDDNDLFTAEAQVQALLAVGEAVMQLARVTGAGGAGASTQIWGGPQ